MKQLIHELKAERFGRIVAMTVFTCLVHFSRLRNYCRSETNARAPASHALKAMPDTSMPQFRYSKVALASNSFACI